MLCRWNRWAATEEEACRATHVEHRQSEALLDLRTACLDRRRATLAALVELWTSQPLTPKALQHAPSAAASLPSIEDCSDSRALSAPLPEPKDPAVLKEIAAVRAELDRTRALLAIGDWVAARSRVEAAMARAAITHYPPVEAEARWLLGEALNSLHEAGGGEQALTEAARLAELAHDSLVLLLAVPKQEPDNALLLSRVAEATVARAGDPPELRGRLLDARGNALMHAGKFREAKEVLLEANKLLPTWTRFAHQSPRMVEDAPGLGSGSARIRSSSFLVQGRANTGSGP